MTQARHPVGAGRREKPAFDDDVWELYDTNTDWTQAHDLASEQPEKLAELQRLFLIEATKYNVLPLDDRVAERLIPELAGRPTLVQGDRQLLYGGMGRLSESSIVSIKNKSHAVTAEIEVPDGGARGRDHRPGRQHRRLEPLPQGRQAALLLQPARHPALLRRRRHARSRPARTRCGMEFDYAGPGHGQGRHRDALPRRREGRRGRGRGHGGHDLLRRRHLRRRRGERRARRRRLPGAEHASPARSTGSRSTSATPPPTPTTSSTRRSCSASRWPGSNAWCPATTTSSRCGRRRPTPIDTSTPEEAA